MFSAVTTTALAAAVARLCRRTEIAEVGGQFGVEGVVEGHRHGIARLAATTTTTTVVTATAIAATTVATTAVAATTVAIATATVTTVTTITAVG